MITIYIDSLLANNSFLFVLIAEGIIFYYLQLTILFRTNRKLFRLIPLIILSIDAEICSLIYYGVIRYNLNFEDRILLARKGAAIDLAIFICISLSQITYSIINRKRHNINNAADS